MNKKNRSIINDLKFEVWKSVHTLPLPFQILWQHNQLNRLLRYASKMRIYEELWQPLDANKNFKYSWRILHQLPIINKNTFKNRQPNKYLSVRTIQNPYWTYTSGSSAEPFRFVVADLPIKYLEFLRKRFLWWRKINLEDIMKKIKTATIRRATFSNAARLVIPVADFLKNPEETTNLLSHFEPEIIITYPSIFIELSRYAKGALKPKFALCYGEILTKGQRDFISSKFSCEVYNLYGLKECGAVGIECEKHDGFHLNSESFILEIVDEKGKQLPAGNVGKIIITDLLNYNMPFIRYETGDMGSILDKQCDCGLPSLRFAVVGRHSAFLKIGSSKIHHCELEEIFNTENKYILQYQIAKRSPTILEITIVPTPAFNNTYKNELINKIKGLVDDNIQINIKLANTVERTQSGKNRGIVA